MSQPAPAAPDEMTIRLRGNKLIIDLDEGTLQTIKNLAQMTKFDPPAIVKRAFGKGLAATYDDAHVYIKQINSANQTFMNTGPAPAQPPKDNGADTPPDPETETDATWEAEPAAAGAESQQP